MPQGYDEEDEMLNAFGIFSGAVGLVLIVWFFNLGFMVRRVLKEQQETNRLLRHLGNAIPSPATV
jgi:hypothetical protein